MLPPSDTQIRAAVGSIASETTGELPSVTGPPSWVPSSLKPSTSVALVAIENPAVQTSPLAESTPIAPPAPGSFGLTAIRVTALVASAIFMTSPFRVRAKMRPVAGSAASAAIPVSALPRLTVCVAEVLSVISVTAMEVLEAAQTVPDAARRPILQFCRSAGQSRAKLDCLYRLYHSPLSLVLASFPVEPLIGGDAAEQHRIAAR